jgi:hypothetical protein
MGGTHEKQLGRRPAEKKFTLGFAKVMQVHNSVLGMEWQEMAGCFRHMTRLG